MDIISELTQKMGVNTEQAQGLAGGLLGMVQNVVKEKIGASAAGSIAQAIPELSNWTQSAQTAQASGAPAGLGGLVGNLMGGLAGGDLGQLTSLLGKFNISPDKIAIVGPIVFSFLKSKLDPALVNQIASAIPMLGGIIGNTQAAPGGIMGGISGALDGFLNQQK